MSEPQTFDTLVVRYISSSGDEPPALNGWEWSLDGESWAALELTEPTAARGPYRILKTPAPIEAQHLRVNDADFLKGAGEIDLF